MDTDTQRMPCDGEGRGQSHQPQPRNAKHLDPTGDWKGRNDLRWGLQQCGICLSLLLL